MTAHDPVDRDAAVEDEHERNTELLRAELPNYRLADSAYLRWLYDENPIGHAIRRQADDDHGVRIAHYAMIPQRYRGAGGHGTGGVLAARSRPHGHAAARAVPHPRTRGHRRGPGRGLEVRRRSLQREVDRHRREVPGLEDPGSTAGAHLSRR